MDVKFSFITTVYNESATIVPFLESILNQTKLPDEIVIVDAQSTDDTIKKIKNTLGNQKKIPWQLIIEKGNRSVGRNIAIKNSSYGYIACSDAGCTLEPSWLEEISKPLIESNSIDVVSGWYKPIATTQWQEALSKVLNFQVNGVNPDSFLPSSRSIAFKKTAWQKAGMYPEHLLTAEDTLFDINLKKSGAVFYFQPNAVVYWKLVNNYRALYRMIWRYAYGDAEARIFSSQYRIIFTFLLMVTALLIASLLIPLLALFAALCFFGYLYLPFWQNKSINSVAEIWQVPLIKLTIIAANTLGYAQGLMKSKEL